MRFGSVGSFPEELVQTQTGLGNQEDIKGEKGQNVWSKSGKNDQALDKHSFFTKPLDFTENTLPSTLHSDRVLNQQLDHDPYNSFAAPELLSNYILDVGLSGGHKDFFFSASNNNHIQSGYKQPQQRLFPSSKLSGDLFINGNTVAALDASNHPAEDLIFSKKPPTLSPSRHRLKNHKTKHIPVFSPDDDNFIGTPHIRSLTKPPSLNYFMPSNHIYIPNYQGKNMKKPLKSFKGYRSIGCKKSKDEEHRFTCSNGSPESASNLFFSHLGLEANKPQSKQGGSRLGFNVKPSHTQHDSTRIPSSPEHPSFNSGPFTLAAPPEYMENSARHKLDEKVVIQQKGTQKAIPALRAFSAQDRFLFLNGGYEDAMKAGLLKPVIQPDVLQLLSDTMKTEPSNFASWPSELLSEPKDADLKCIIWKNAKSSSAPNSQKSSRSSVSTYIKSKNRSTRATTFLLRTCYIPSQQATKPQWKMP